MVERANRCTKTRDWSLIADVKNNPRMHIPVIGNGDVDSPETALEKKEKYGVDGIILESRHWLSVDF